MPKITRAVISVSDKDGISEFARGLSDLGVEILSTGGTAKKLREDGIEVKDISEHTGSPEILGGRVKTLHPKLHGGILALREDSTHSEQMKENDIEPIDLVVVNLYPFEEVIKKESTTFEEAIENIDIGGPTMLRAAAKNYRYVTLVTSPEDYEQVLGELTASGGSVSEETNFKLAVKAFSYVARYDAAISNYLGALTGDGQSSKFPESLTVYMDKRMKLRYGENPHQEGAFYVEAGIDRPCISNSEQLQGKELSPNNIYDTDAALEAVKDYQEGACVIVKHNNPCGVATDESVVEAFLKAKACDPVSSFGGIVAFNREVDEETSKELAAMFLEVVIAPGYTDEALETLSEKSNLRVMKTPPLENGVKPGLDFKKVLGGALVQDRDTGIENDFKDMRVETKRQPTDEELSALKFAWS